MQNSLLMRPDDSEFMIPDDWTGRKDKYITEERDSGFSSSLLPLKSFYCSPVCTTIDLISENNCFAMGVRFLLEKKRDLRLNHVKDYSYKNITKPDIIIMTGCTVSDAYSIFSRIVEENIQQSITPIIVISGRDADILNSISSKLGGITMISPTETTYEIEKKINEAINRKSKRKRLLSDILTPQQFMTVKMVANGKSANEIAKSMNISIKTVYAHKAHAIKKLGIGSKIYEALFYKALKQLS